MPYLGVSAWAPFDRFLLCKISYCFEKPVSLSLFHTDLKSSRRSDLSQYQEVTIGGSTIQCRVRVEMEETLENQDLSKQNVEIPKEKNRSLKVEQMQPAQLCVLLQKQFEGSCENTRCGKVQQMQPVWLCIISGRQFEETFEYTQWRKVKQM